MVGDICPAGWHLPTGSSGTGEYYILNRDVNNGSVSESSGLRAYPVNFVYSGNVTSASINDRGIDGSYWTASAISSNFAYDLDFNSDSFYPGTKLDSGFIGMAVRCVAGT